MLFITKYEDECSSFGGMVRVKDIEGIAGCNSGFLHLFFLKPFHKRNYINKQGNVVFELGILRFFSILKVIKNYNSLYFHTVGNFIKLFPYIFAIKKNMILDLHGAQPEELFYSKKFFKGFIYNFFETLAFHYCKYFIHVSKAMEMHFAKKYPHNTGINLYVPIVSKQIKEGLCNNDLIIDEHFLSLKLKYKEQLGYTVNDELFIYSGGFQKWQCTGYIKEFINIQIKNNPHSKFLILSRQVDLFTTLLKEELLTGKVKIKSAFPDELRSYYLAADFGIMFREDSILNEVASPTKLSEYLFYGMIPILKSVNVGDFVSEGMFYFLFESKKFNISLPYIKRNKEILLNSIKNSDECLLSKVLRREDLYVEKC